MFNQTDSSSSVLAVGVSSSSDYKQYTYDPNGDITVDRRRNCTTISYADDALNRSIATATGGKLARLGPCGRSRSPPPCHPARQRRARVFFGDGYDTAYLDLIESAARRARTEVWPMA